MTAPRVFNKFLEQALKAADNLIQNGGLGLIVIDLGEVDDVRCERYRSQHDSDLPGSSKSNRLLLAASFLCSGLSDSTCLTG
jgi:hypothetical protein